MLPAYTIGDDDDNDNDTNEDRAAVVGVRATAPGAPTHGHSAPAAADHADPGDAGTSSGGSKMVAGVRPPPATKAH